MEESCNSTGSHSHANTEVLIESNDYDNDGLGFSRKNKIKKVYKKQNYSLEKQQYVFDKQLSGFEKRKRNYFIVFFISVLISIITQGFLIALNIQFSLMNFFIYLPILSLILSAIIILLDIFSLLLFRNLIVRKRKYLIIYASLFFSFLQQIVNIIILIKVFKFSICGSFIWNSSECFANSDVQNFYDNKYSSCDDFDSDKFAIQFYQEEKNCFNDYNIPQDEFVGDVSILENINYISVLISAISYKLTLNIILNISMIIKSLKINRMIGKQQKQIEYLSSYSSSTYSS